MNYKVLLCIVVAFSTSQIIVNGSTSRQFDICIVKSSVPAYLSYEQLEFEMKIAVEAYRRFTHLAFNFTCHNPRMFLAFVPPEHKRHHGYTNITGFFKDNHDDTEMCDALERNVLAHAFYPPYFDIHINNAVRYSFTRNIVYNFIVRQYSDGTNVVLIKKSYPILPILMHEFGHSMGLRHSPDYDSVMKSGNILNYGLSEDDIKKLQMIWKSDYNI